MTNNKTIQNVTSPKNFQDQISAAKKHNIVFGNNNQLNKLKMVNLNYVWLQHYGCRLELFDYKNDKFLKPIKFDDIYQLFELDKKFSILILNLILLLEKNLKSRFASGISVEFNVTSVRDKRFQNLFLETNEWYKANFSTFFGRNEYFKKEPIIWNFIEHISIGDLQIMIKNLNTKIKKVNTFRNDFINHYCSIQQLDTLRKIRNLISHSQPFIKNFKGIDYFNPAKKANETITFPVLYGMIKSVCEKCLGQTAKIYLDEIDNFLATYSSYSSKL